MQKNTDVPFVPASANIPEITLQAVLLGTILGVILAAASAYLGLYAGMTVSASIPAAVISMGILKGILRRGTILENNIVQTIAASGESLAAGVIFTIPAMLIAGVWTDIRFWPTTLICISGGFLGICFMIPLRRTHIVEDRTLTFPEGVACAEVLKAGDRGGSGAKTVLISIVVGVVFKFFVGGVSLIKGTVEWAFSWGRLPVFMGSDVSPALLGVGYIVGLHVAVLIFMGGIVAWTFAIPILGTTPAPASHGELMGWFWKTWSDEVRYMGVGGMIAGGIWSIFTIRHGMAAGLKEAVFGYTRREGGKAAAVPRTEQNMARHHIALLLAGTVILTFILYYFLIEQTGITIVATLSMVVMSFFFVAVASYIVGLVGSSNSPVSGMTICAVLVTAGLLFLLGMTGEKAIIATLGVAGVVCCAACSAGDISQDLKTGYLIGATPRNQQWMEVVGASIPAFVMAPVLVVLHHAYGIGTGHPGSLKAPQASLFASLVKGIFGTGTIPWNFVFIGIAVGGAIIVADQLLKARGARFRTPVMAVAVGMYLPLTLSVPIFLGGLVAAAIKQSRDTRAGTLFSSGLIAGEAITGVLLGAVIYLNKEALPIPVLDSNLLSAFALLALAILLYQVSKRTKK